LSCASELWPVSATQIELPSNTMPSTHSPSMWTLGLSVTVSLLAGPAIASADAASASRT
jgi:hypothetical protein